MTQYIVAWDDPDLGEVTRSFENRGEAEQYARRKGRTYKNVDVRAIGMPRNNSKGGRMASKKETGRKRVEASMKKLVDMLKKEKNAKRRAEIKARIKAMQSASTKRRAEGLKPGKVGGRTVKRGYEEPPGRSGRLKSSRSKAMTTKKYPMVKSPSRTIGPAKKLPPKPKTNPPKGKKWRFNKRLGKWGLVAAALAGGVGLLKNSSGPDKKGTGRKGTDPRPDQSRPFSDYDPGSGHYIPEGDKHPATDASRAGKSYKPGKGKKAVATKKGSAAAHGVMAGVTPGKKGAVKKSPAKKPGVASAKQKIVKGEQAVSKAQGTTRVRRMFKRAESLKGSPEGVTAKEAAVAAAATAIAGQVPGINRTAHDIAGFLGKNLRPLGLAGIAAGSVALIAKELAAHRKGKDSPTRSGIRKGMDYLKGGKSGGRKPASKTRRFAKR